MLSEKMINALNEQIAFEGYASFLYLAQAGWFENKSMVGCASFMYRQSPILNNARSRPLSRAVSFFQGRTNFKNQKSAILVRQSNYECMNDELRIVADLPNDIPK